MNINSNISLRERSRVTLSGFKGLDTLSSVVDVNAIHATEMQNLISRDGVNHKRYGWKTQYRLRDHSQFLKIQGIFNFTLFYIDFLIVYASYVDNTTNNTENRFYLIDRETNTSTDITSRSLDKNGKVTGEIINTSVSPVDTRELLNTECKCFINGDKAYFIGCGDFLVFSKWNVGDNEYFELRRVVENEDVHIPTTTENIGSEEHGKEYTRITAEERNLLSPYVYNTLFGVDTLEGTDKATYYLDTKDFTSIQVEVERKGKATVVLKEAKETVGEGVTTSTKVVYKEGDIVTNLNFTVGSYEDITEWNTIMYGSDGVGKVVFSPDTYVHLLRMTNGGLYIKNTVKTYTDYKEYDDGTYKIKYKFPEKISYSLIYKRGSGEEINLRTIAEKPVGGEIVEVLSKTRVETKITVDYGMFNCDLTSYGGQIELFWFKPDDGYYRYEYNTSAGNTIKLKDSSGKYTGDYEASEGKLVLYSVNGTNDAYCPLVPDVPNIKVKIGKDSAYDPSMITNAIKSCEFGAQGGTDRLFIVDSTGNTVRWSKDEDFTYFGHKSWCVCGTSDKSITGMDRLNDSTLLIVKEYSPIEPSIFVITGNIVTGKTEADTVDYTALFAPHGYQVGMGAVGEIVNFNGECIMVAKDGLYAVSLGENMTVDSRYVLHRSRQISNKLEKFNLANAKCVSVNGKFLIAVGGEEKECYVADNKYVASFKGDMQNVVNYEWWRWTNIPANVWGFVNNELWFGTEDGQLCSFTENFYDETITYLHNGLVAYESVDGEIVGIDLLDTIPVCIGDILTPTCDFYGGITTSKFEVVGEETRFYLPKKELADNDIIYINETSYSLTKQDLYFSINYTPTDTEKQITFYRNYKGKRLVVDKEGFNENAKVVRLKDIEGNSPLWANVVENDKGLNPTILNFTATLSHKEAVVAKWVSGATDLGTRVYAKSLTYLVLTGEKDLANRLKYGLKTRFTHRDYEFLRANNDLDFEGLDLSTVSLDSEFASSYSRRLNIRDVNFLMFYFMSDTAEDIAINSVQIEFKLYKRNKGVR